MYGRRLITGIAERWAGETTATYNATPHISVTGSPEWFPGLSPSIDPTMRNHSLFAEYEGRTVEDVFGGHEVHTPEGTCFAVESSEKININMPDWSAITTAVMQDLCLIPGIGEITANKLHMRGIQTIADLVSHTRFGADACMISDLTAAEDWASLEAYCRRHRSSSDGLFLLLSLATSLPDLLFFDIETLGMFSRPAILLGTGRIRNKKMTITQYLLRDIGEEPGALCAVLEEINDSTRLVTYNGRAFDFPYIINRAGYYGISAPAEPAHIDLLHHVRRQWKRHLPNCRLGTVEGEILGQYRDDDLPGSLVPWYYQTYQRSGNPWPLIPVMEHNRLDIANLPRIYERLLESVTCPQR